MRKKIVQFAAVLLAAAICVPPVARAADAPVNPMLRAGLFWGDSALPSANLENSVGSGYRFGYFDDSRDFYQVGWTEETQITMLKAQNMYMTNGTYSESPSGGSTAVGCFHLQLPGDYDSFDSAQSAARQLSGGFPAWVNGSYCVRAGAYDSKDAALQAQSALGLYDASVAGTSSNGVTVVDTKTARVLFQFDGGDAFSLAVRPGLDDSTLTATWFKGFRYYGSFQYQRRGGGNLTVVNFVPLEDYLKGVVPHEMGPTWPLEALKAQALCARNYAVMNRNKHNKHGFDVCNTIDCQVYQGLNGATENSDQAVDETYGRYIWYNGQLAETYYFSSDGGATENARNVWNPTAAPIPYLTGVIDPYEADVVDWAPHYNWSVTYTKAELAQKLNASGRACSGVADFYVAEYTPTGNVLTITFVTTDGKHYSISYEKARTFLGLNSQRYTISSGGGGGGGYSVNDGGATIPTVSGAYAIDGSGNLAPISGAPYVATASGTEILTAPGAGSGTASGNSFTITGTGWGHNVGMSQCGANAMAKRGMTYEEILKFYFTGVDIY